MVPTGAGPRPAVEEANLTPEEPLAALGAADTRGACTLPCRRSAMTWSSAGVAREGGRSSSPRFARQDAGHWAVAVPRGRSWVHPPRLQVARPPDPTISPFPHAPGRSGPTHGNTSSCALSPSAARGPGQGRVCEGQGSLTDPTSCTASLHWRGQPIASTMGDRVSPPRPSTVTPVQGTVNFCGAKRRFCNTPQHRLSRVCG
jgi:hypothetical protein